MPTGQNYVSTAPQTTLTGGINNSQTNAITVASFTGWPAPPFSLTFDIGTLGYEVIDVLTVSGNTITSCNRGVDGTSASSHSNNATVTHASIGRDFREARAHIDASASNDSTGHAVHGLTSGSSVVGTTDVQVLTNKTISGGTISSGTGISNPAITGTVTGGAFYNNITALTTAVGNSPLISKGIANETAPIFDVQDSSANHLLRVLANGATGAGAVNISPTDTGTASLVVNAPSGTTSDLLDLNINGVGQLAVDDTGSLNLLKGPLYVVGLTGAVHNSRYVGSTLGGPPVSGSFATGDFVVDQVNAAIWTCTSGGSPGTWNTPGEVLLAKSSLGAPAGTVTFSSIPQYFRHLKIRMNGKTSWAGGAIDTVFLTFNNITTANYSWVAESVNNTSAPVNQNGAAQISAWCGVAWGNQFATQGSGMSEVFIPDYTLSTFGKIFKWEGHASDGGSTHEHVVGGGALAPGTLLGAVTRIDLVTTNANWVTGSTFELYGIS